MVDSTTEDIVRKAGILKNHTYLDTHTVQVSNLRYLKKTSRLRHFAEKDASGRSSEMQEAFQES